MSGQEGETQARRRTVVVLQDEMRRVLDAARVQQIESSIDGKYRVAVATTMKIATNVKELIIVKEVLEAIENCSDAMLAAADASTILALGL